MLNFVANSTLQNMSTSSQKSPKKETLKSSLVQQIIEVFAHNPNTGYNYKQLSRAIRVGDKASRELVHDTLFQLEEDQVIEQIHRGKFRLKGEHLSKYIKTSEIEGVVDMKNTGKAYITSPKLDEDIFIAANNTNRAFDGDTVKVRLFPKRGGRKMEGQIVEIVKRKKTQFVGIIEIGKKFAFMVPDSDKITFDFFIPLENLNKAQNGDKVLVNLLDWPEHSRNPFAEVIKVLGKPGNNDVEMLSILADNDFPLCFPKEAEAEAAKISNTVDPAEIAKRKDFRDIFTCTIDPVDAKDFDDALSLRKLENGHWEVGVHIADVTHYVKQGSAIEKEAYERATSIYLVDRTIPMLPEQLSNLVCSLRPDEEKLTFSAVFELDEQSKIYKEWFGRTVIRSNRRYAYEEVQAIIEGADGDYKEELMVLHKLSSNLREERFRQGSINFKSEEIRFILDENGKPISAFLKMQKEANFLIEDFMLLANKKVAEWVGTKKIGEKQQAKTFVYRIHDVPNQEKLQQFSEFLRKLGYRLSLASRKSLVQSFNRLFEDIAGKGEERMIETISIRTMAKAIYSTQNIGHYGLSFKYYTHFTSPIRRYPDMMVHRLLQRYLDGQAEVNPTEYEEYCKHSSEMEKKAAEAERESVKYKQMEFMLDKIGQQFTGKISGVSKWGLFVEITEVKSEGLVAIQSMADDFYYLDEDNYKIIGRAHGQEYRLGDSVQVIVKQVNLNKRQMDLTLVSEEEYKHFPSPKKDRTYNRNSKRGR
jgi:ribonuclease R